MNPDYYERTEGSGHQGNREGDYGEIKWSWSVILKNESYRWRTKKVL